jgi:hypothetical protein
MLPIIVLAKTPPMPLKCKNLHQIVAVILSHLRFHDFAVTDLIWNVAPGSSDVSPCTVAFIPMLASAPLIIPQGNHRNYLSNKIQEKIIT